MVYEYKTFMTRADDRPTHSDTPAIVNFRLNSLKRSRTLKPIKAHVSRQATQPQSTMVYSPNCSLASARHTKKDDKKSAAGSSTRNCDDACLKIVNSRIFELALSLPSEKFKRLVRFSDTGTANPAEFTLDFPELFRSVCICDPKITGAPVRLRSKFFTLGPRGLQVGHCAFLNLPSANDHEHCVLTVRPDANGRTRYVLEYTATLFGQESGRAAYVVASQMDISKTIRQLALASIAHSSTTPQLRRRGSERDLRWRASERDSPTEKTSWTTAPPGTQDSYSLSSSSSTQLTSLELDMNALQDFNDLIVDLKFLHRLCFTLSPTHDAAFYKITWLSSHINTHRDDLAIGFEKNDPAVLHELGKRLSGSDLVTVLLKWGSKNKNVRVYCVPMFNGPDLGCWLCFLLDANIPSFWKVQ